jgi:hypothetical protein
VVGPLDAGRADERARASYVTKLGFEIAGVGKPARSTWDLAARAVAGDRACARAWREFEQATRGARMVEMDERAALLARRGKLERETEAFWEEAEQVAEADTIDIPIDRSELGLLKALEFHDRTFLARMLHAVQHARAPREAWRDWLDDAAVIASGWRFKHGQEEDADAYAHHRRAAVGPSAHDDSRARRGVAAQGDAPT